MKTLTIGDLKRWLASIDASKDDLEVVLRIDDQEEGNVTVCGLHELAIEAGCTETEALMLDGELEEDEGGSVVIAPMPPENTVTRRLGPWHKIGPERYEREDRDRPGLWGAVAYTSPPGCWHWMTTDNAHGASGADADSAQCAMDAADEHSEMCGWGLAEEPA